MTKVLKAGALWLAIMVVVWLFTIWHWQSTAYEASTGSIVGQLFVLPVLLTVALLLAMSSVARLRARAAEPLAIDSNKVRDAAAANGAASDAAAKPQTDGALRQASAWVLAEAVSLSVGDDARSAWETLRGGAVRPRLDSSLEDADGLPVFACRVPGLDVQVWQHMHAPDLMQAAGLEAGQPFPEGVQRALALLEPALQALLDRLDEICGNHGLPFGHEGDVGGHGKEPSAPGAPPAHLSGMVRPVSHEAAAARDARAPALNVRLLLPTDWDRSEREAAIACIRGRCGSVLDWAQRVGAKGVRWLTDTLDRPEAWWDEFDQDLSRWCRDTRPELLLILALDSGVHQPHVEHLQSVGELFTALHQTGKVPGEGAAGLLIANEAWMACHGASMPTSDRPLKLWRPLRARRDESADAAGRVGTATLRAAFESAFSRVLEQAGAESRARGLLVVSDADHRPSRTAELFESLQDTAPGLDPMLAVSRLGEACGEIGMARAVAPAALACAALRQAESPDEWAIAAHLQSPHERVVVALSQSRPSPQRAEA